MVLSRGQLNAAIVGALVALSGSFAAGVVVGERTRGEGGEHERVALVDNAAEESLVELLARVEASADPTGGVSGLSYPDALRLELQAPPGPVAVPPTVGQAAVEAGLQDSPEGALDDLPPVGPWAVALGFFSDEEELLAVRQASLVVPEPWWQALVLVDGVAGRRAGVGAFGSEDAAKRALATLVAAGAVEEGFEAEVFRVP